jgi:hypothetical protein
MEKELLWVVVESNSVEYLLIKVMFILGEIVILVN